jgi:hypothetical protein
VEPPKAAAEAAPAAKVDELGQRPRHETLARPPVAVAPSADPTPVGGGGVDGLVGVRGGLFAAARSRSRRRTGRGAGRRRHARYLADDEGTPEGALPNDHK